MSDRSIYRIAWALLNLEFKPGDDTFKGVSKDIHNAALHAGWRLDPTWPPPQPGDHESDLWRNGTIGTVHDDADPAKIGWTAADLEEYITARLWSLHGQGTPPADRWPR